MPRPTTAPADEPTRSFMKSSRKLYCLALSARAASAFIDDQSATLRRAEVLLPAVP